MNTDGPSIAPCGPECRHASAIAATAGCDYVWCHRTGAPRFVGPEATDCRWYAPELNAKPAVAVTEPVR